MCPLTNSVSEFFFSKKRQKPTQKSYFVIYIHPKLRLYGLLCLLLCRFSPKKQHTNNTTSKNSRPPGDRVWQETALMCTIKIC